MTESPLTFDSPELDEFEQELFGFGMRIQIRHDPRDDVPLLFVRWICVACGVIVVDRKLTPDQLPAAGLADIALTVEHAWTCCGVQN